MRRGLLLEVMMTSADRQRFAKAITLLAVGLDVTITQQRLEILFEDLGDQPIWAVEWAAKEARRRMRFFPKASELLELARIAPRPPGVGLPEPEERPLLEETTPPEVAIQKLQEIANGLNRLYGTRFYVGENQGRPVMMGTKRSSKDRSC